MKEAAFIKLNKRRWEQYEKDLDQQQQLSPDDLARIYINLTDDLAFAQSQFPKSDLVAYLNALTLKFHHSVYVNKGERRSRIISFWKSELPAIMAESRKELLYSALIFAISITIGAISQAHDAGFSRLILGDQYVNMTIENIRNEDPMAVYKKMHQMDMFLAITVNNIRVSFMVFVMGIFTSLATGYLLFQNGVMLGTFQYFFFQKGLLTTSVLTIWLHGTLEISAIIIAGAAGMVLGNGWLYPGSYSRLQSLRMAAKKGLKIIIGIVPIFIVAGFIEGFITRLTNMPNFLKVAIVGISALFVIFYFIIYPYKHQHNASRKQN